MSIKYRNVITSIRNKTYKELLKDICKSINYEFRVKMYTTFNSRLYQLRYKLVPFFNRIPSENHYTFEDDRLSSFFRKIEGYLDWNWQYSYWCSKSYYFPKSYKLSIFSLIYRLLEDIEVTSKNKFHFFPSFLPFISDFSYYFSNKKYFASEIINKTLFQESYFQIDNSFYGRGHYHRTFARIFDKLIQTMPINEPIYIRDYIHFILENSTEWKTGYEYIRRGTISDFFCETSKKTYKDSMFNLVRSEILEKLRTWELVYTKGYLEKKNITSTRTRRN